MARTQSPFALISLRDSGLRAGAVVGYDVQRSLFEPVGRATVKLAAADDIELNPGDRFDLWIGDLSVGLSGSRWLVFGGFISDHNDRPDVILNAHDFGFQLQQAKIEAPVAARRQDMRYWLEFVLNQIGGATPVLDVDLPGRNRPTRFDDELFVIDNKRRRARVSGADTDRLINGSEFLSRLADHYRVIESFGENISYYFTTDNVMVWKQWTPPADDRDSIEYGRNLVALELGEIAEGIPHRFELMPSPWFQPGDTFSWIEREENPRLEDGRFRVDTLRHLRQEGFTRTEIFSRTRLN